MKNNKDESNFTKDSKEVLHYMQALVEVARESFLILDADLKVLAANPIFYQVFQVTPEETVGKFIYNLGNSQWDIPSLRSLLEGILPKKKNVKDYGVTHVFENIGEKSMLLNASQIDSLKLIILAIEDISTRKALENKLADYTRELEVKVNERTKELANRVKELEENNKTMVGRELKMVELKKEIEDLKKRLKI